MESVSRVSERTATKRRSLPAGWEVALWGYLFLLLTPHTLGSLPLEWLLDKFWHILYVTGILGSLTVFSYYGLLYACGAGLLIYLLFLWWVASFTSSRWTVQVKPVLFTVFLLSIVFLFDFLTSTSDPYSYESTFWVFYAFIVFFMVVLFADELQAARMAKVLLVVIGLQSAYGILYYLMGVKQFYTPHFGYRTGGTFGDPNAFYPLCVVGVPLALALGVGAASRWWRCVSLLIAGLCSAALFLTFTRTGWLSLIPALFVLGFHSGSPVQGKKYWQIIVLVIALLFFIATLFVRTRGDFVANPSDRSFWGRTAIWAVAFSAIPSQLWWGHGIDTYPDVQRSHMSPNLQAFNPMNIEPKNLYLHLAVERGLIGLGLFLSVVLFGWKMIRGGIRGTPNGAEQQGILLGSASSLLAVLAAGLSDTPIFHSVRFAPTVAVAMLFAVSCVLSNQNGSQRENTIGLLTQKRRRFWRRFILSVSGLAILCVLGWAYTHWVLSSVCSQLRKLQTGAVQGRPFTPLPQISPVFLDCVIASEDGRFYTHGGVDWTALHRAVRANVRSLKLVQGGSTLTMQTARYLFLGRQRTPLRKLAEVSVAMEMERVLSKPRILELYCNTVRFGLGAEDIGTAARRYFGKKPSELTLGEAAFLAGVLPEPPSTPEDLTPEKVVRCKKRALNRLQSFFGNRYSSDEIQKAQEQPLQFTLKR